MGSDLYSMLLGTSGLAGIATISVWLAATRRPPSGAALPELVRLAALGVLFQAAHFAEEFVTGFRVRFPELLGLAPWPTSFFLVFNLSWLVIWVLAIPALRTHSPLAAFAIWFLAIASTANGLVHPLLSVATAGYFPGLWSSPFVGILGLFIWRALASATRVDGASHGTT